MLMQVRSKIFSGTPAPLWNQILVLELGEPPHKITLEVQHSPEVVAANREPPPGELLGSKTIVIRDEHPDDWFSDQWHTLRTEGSDSRQEASGKVRLAISFDRGPLQKLQKGFVPPSKGFARMVRFIQIVMWAPWPVPTWQDFHAHIRCSFLPHKLVTNLVHERSFLYLLHLLHENKSQRIERIERHCHEVPEFPCLCQ
jgi:hypothetical protein